MSKRPPLRDAALTALRNLRSGDEVRTRPVDLAAIAHDASHYLLQPQALMAALDTTHVADILRVARTQGLPVTFRSGGTSLSGQAGGEGLLVDTRRHFRHIEVLDGGARVRVQPGATVRSVNARLAPHHVKLGPDPASEAACTVGGVVANNSSGMACGIELNAYRTMESLVFVLPSGTVIDTADPHADDALAAQEPRVWSGLRALRERLRDNNESVATIRRQFAMKNTMGYALNAFLDFDRPVDILSHLLVGSEGTLAFVGEVTFRTVPIRPLASTALLVFDSMSKATDALPALVALGAATVELLDAASLRVVQRDSAAPATLAGLHVVRHAALLVELQASSDEEMEAILSGAHGLLADIDVAAPAAFTAEVADRAALWHLRKGLYTAVAGARPSGTTALLEDIVVPLEALTAVTERLTTLFAEHRYDDAVIFGHAKDGNLHFMINPRFDEPDQLRRYAAFTEELVDLVLQVDGSLKAEHGTGRTMAPFVRRQFGGELHDVMRAVKDLCDPTGVLNPGVLLSDDPQAHLSDLKTPMLVHPDVDTCVECGYCEPVCPSRDVTTTPRQRIVLMREIARAEADGDRARADSLRDDFGYAAVDTCATDSMCMIACPVSIDTGAVMKEYRRERHGRAAEIAGGMVAAHWTGVVGGLRTGLRIAEALPAAVLQSGSRAARTVLPTEWVPLVDGDLPSPGPRRPRPARSAKDAAVFFPACINTLFGPTSGDSSPAGATAAFQTLCDRAGLRLAVPEGIDGTCCGTPWRSKGFERGYEAIARRTFEAVWASSDGGRLPVVCEASSCSLGLREISQHLRGRDRDDYRELTIIDAVSFVRSAVLPELRVARRLSSVAVHPTCSGVHLGSTDDLLAVARAFSDTVVVPSESGCCGFAGDRGLLHPELTASASAAEALDLQDRQFDAYVSDNRTCEMGLSRASGHAYRHVLEVLESLTR